MFLCISANPAIDKRITLSALKPGEIHRARTARGYPGGKSAHVAMVLRALGAEPVWIGLCGGTTGEELRDGLKKLGIHAESSSIDGKTRTNLEILEDSGSITEIREAGPSVTWGEAAAFESLCREWFRKGREAATVIF